MNGLDFLDVRLSRDEWLHYARRLAAVEGRQAGLLRNKIETGVGALPASEDDRVVLVLSGLDRVFLHDLDQQELDAVQAPVAPPAADAPRPSG